MAKKVKISKVKRTNQQSHKLSRRQGSGHGKAKNRNDRHKIPNWKKKVEQKRQDERKKKREMRVPPPQLVPETEEDALTGEDMLEMIDSEDLPFLRDPRRERCIAVAKRIRCPSPSKPRSKRRESPDDPSLEVDYEAAGAPQDFKRTKLLLPIKTKHGLVMRAKEEELSDDEKEEDNSEDEPEKREIEDAGEDDSDTELPEDDAMEELPLDPNEEMSTADLLAAREELLRKRKFRIGVLASSLLEDPENKAGNFTPLLNMLKEEKSSVRFTVQKLVVVSLLEIFKDVLPGYQIKHPEVSDGTHLKKGTKKLWGFESALIKAYQRYLQHLENMSNALRHKRKETRKACAQALRLAETALRCLAALLINQPYFNFSQNVAQMLVSFLDHRKPAVREIVASALKTVLKEDKRGEISLHIVRRINQLVKKKGHAVRPDVLSVLLALRMKNVNLDAEKENKDKQKKLENKKHKMIQTSRRERRRKRRFEELEKELLETKAEENRVMTQKNLTEVTKVVFTIYFRILKSAPSSQLLCMTLEGIAKFAHVINLEFYQDMVNVLDELLVTENLGIRERLLCVQTVFTILSGQGEVLNIDPIRFYTHLYGCLSEVHAGSTSKEITVALRAVELGILNRRKKVTLQRQMAFTKRLCTMALMQLQGGALGCLGAAHGILMHNSQCEVLLDTDMSHGDGVYMPELPEPEYCGASSATLWELVRLTQHFHPTVRKVAQVVLKGDESNETINLLPADVAKLSCTRLAEQFDCSVMTFRPVVPAPTKSPARSHHGRLLPADQEFYANLRKTEESVDCKSQQVEEAIERWWESLY